MSSKSHGGAGRGQGRKKAVDDPINRIAAGSKCEELWNQRTVNQALEKYEREPITEMIRTAQSRASLIPLRHRKSGSAQATLEDVRGDIEAALVSRRSSRFIQIPLVRLKNAKAQVIAEAISWFKETYGIELTPFRMRRCWDEYRAFADQLRKSPDQQTA